MSHVRNKRNSAPVQVFRGTTVAALNYQLPEGIDGPHGERWVQINANGTWSYRDLDKERKEAEDAKQANDSEPMPGLQS